MMGDPTPNTEPRQLWPWIVAGLAVFVVLCLCLSSVAGFFAYRALQTRQPLFEDFLHDSETDQTTSEDDTVQDDETEEPPDEAGPTGEDVSIQYAGHIEPGEDHTPYNSDPPTSGQHYPVAAEAGFYTEAPEDEQLVHNLEHGYVIIWYNCDDLTSDECEQLQDDIQFAMEEAGNSPLTDTPKLIAVPRPGMDALIALTTWGRLDKFDAFDAKRIVNFIHDFRDKAPEPNIP